MLVYIGTYSKRGSKGIYVYNMDPKSGALTSVGDIGGSVDSPSFLALHPGGKFLYAACESGAGSVAAFALDGKTGIPTLLNQQPAQGGATCFVAVDHHGKTVLAANYGGGSVAALPIAPDGKLLPATAAIQHKGPSRVDPQKRQEEPHAHSINPDAKDRFAVAADLGLDKLLVYRLDSAKSTLTPNDPPSVATKPGPTATTTTAARSPKFRRFPPCRKGLWDRTPALKSPCIRPASSCTAPTGATIVSPSSPSTAVRANCRHSDIRRRRVRPRATSASPRPAIS